MIWLKAVAKGPFGPSSPGAKGSGFLGQGPRTKGLPGRPGPRSPQPKCPRNHPPTSQAFLITCKCCNRHSTLWTHAENTNKKRREPPTEVTGLSKGMPSNSHSGCKRPLSQAQASSGTNTCVLWRIFGRIVVSLFSPRSGFCQSSKHPTRTAPSVFCALETRSHAHSHTRIHVRTLTYRVLASSGASAGVLRRAQTQPASTGATGPRPYRRIRPCRNCVSRYVRDRAPLNIAPRLSVAARIVLAPGNLIASRLT